MYFFLWKIYWLIGTNCIWCVCLTTYAISKSLFSGMISFLNRCRLLTKKVVAGVSTVTLKGSIFGNSMVRYNDLSASMAYHWVQMLSDVFHSRFSHTDLFTWSRQWANGGCDRSTGDAYSSLALVCPGVRKSTLIKSMYKERPNNWYETRQTTFDLMTGCNGDLDHYNDHKIYKMPTLNETPAPSISQWPSST